MSLEQMDYCLWSPGEWVLRASLCPGWPVLSLTLHLSVSPQPWLLWRSILFAVVFVSRVVSHFVNLFSYKTVFFFCLPTMYLYGSLCVVLGSGRKAAPEGRRMPGRAVPACSLARPFNVKPNKSADT